MKLFEINLAEPFERVLTRVRSLPWDRACPADNGAADDPELKQALRGLYEAANGRQVQTPLGWIAIAPPVAAFLKARPFYVETQMDLLVQAATRIISGPPNSYNGIATAESAGPTRHPPDTAPPLLDETKAGEIDSAFRERDTVHPSGTQMISLRHD
ncbi:MAG TPA: hypothetical protein VEX43_03100 [Chthoniobacterales bacterium]|nr:hypothetical protein [Chthoniobacterales bacterium]